MPKRWLRPGWLLKLSVFYHWESPHGKSPGIPWIFLSDIVGGSLSKSKAMHMLMTTLLSLLLYTVAPSLYPSMDKARENWRTDTWRMTTAGDLSGGRHPEGGMGQYLCDPMRVPQNRRFIMEKPTLMDDLGYPPFDFCLFCVVFCLAGGAAGLVGGFTEGWMLGCSTIPCQPRQFEDRWTDLGFTFLQNP